MILEECCKGWMEAGEKSLYVSLHMCPEGRRYSSTCFADHSMGAGQWVSIELMLTLQGAERKQCSWEQLWTLRFSTWSGWCPFDSAWISVFEGARSLGHLQRKLSFFFSLFYYYFFIPGGDTLLFSKQLRTGKYFWHCWCPSGFIRL